MKNTSFFSRKIKYNNNKYLKLNRYIDFDKSTFYLIFRLFNQYFNFDASILL